MGDLVAVETQGVSNDWAQADGSFDTRTRGSLDKEQVLSAMVHVAALDTPGGDDVCPPCVTARRRGGSFSFYGQGGALYSPEADREISPAEAVDMAFGKVTYAPPPMPARGAPPPPDLAPAPVARRRRRMGWAAKFVMLLAVFAFIGAVVMLFGVASMQKRGVSGDDILAAKTMSGALAVIGALMAALALKARKTYYVGDRGQPVDADGQDLTFVKMAHNIGDFDSDDYSDYDDGGDFD